WTPGAGLALNVRAEVVGDQFSHGLRIGTLSPLRKTAPYGRPAHRLGDCAGRSPGSRVSTCRPAFPVSQWPIRPTDSPLTVAGAATASTNVVATVFPLASPARAGEPARRKCSIGPGRLSRHGAGTPTNEGDRHKAGLPRRRAGVWRQLVPFGATLP